MEEFLRIDANRAELFTCLAVHLTHLETEKQVVTTNGADALCTLAPSPRGTMKRLTAE